MNKINLILFSSSPIIRFTVAGLALLFCVLYFGPREAWSEPTELRIQMPSDLLDDVLIQTLENQLSCRIVFLPDVGGSDSPVPDVMLVAREQKRTKLGTDGTAHAVPFFVRAHGLMYRPETVHMDQPSWALFSRDEFRGQLMLPAEMHQVIGSGLLYLGVSPENPTRAEINQAVNVLIRWKRNVGTFETAAIREGLLSGVLTAALAPSDLFSLEESQTAELAFALPEEGFFIETDYLIIPPGAAQPELAEKMINLLLRSDLSSDLMRKTGRLIPHAHAVNALPPDLQSDMRFGGLWQQLDRGKPLPSPARTGELYQGAWNRLNDFR